MWGIPGVLLLIVTSCHKPVENTYLIPEDANIVAIVDMESLIRKGRLFNMSGYYFAQSQKDSARYVKLAELFGQISRKPGSIGLSFTEDVAMFMNVRTYEPEEQKDLGLLNNEPERKKYTYLAQYEEENGDEYNYYDDETWEDDADWEDWEETGSDGEGDEDWDSYNYYDEFESGEDDAGWDDLEEGTSGDDGYQWDDGGSYSDENQEMEVVFLGITANISSKKKFSKFVRQQLEGIVSEILEDKDFELKVSEYEDYAICFAGDDLALAWDDDKALLLHTPCVKNQKVLEDLAEELFSMKKDESLPTKGEFQDFYKANQDISLFLSSDFTGDNASIQSCVNDVSLEENPLSFLFDLIDMVSVLPMKDKHLFGYLDFDEGAIRWTTTFHMKREEMKKFKEYKLWDNTFNTKLLRSFPAENMVAGSMAFNPSGLYKMIKNTLTSGDEGSGSIGGEIDSFLKDLFNSMDGSILISLMDIKNLAYEKTIHERVYNPKKSWHVPYNSSDTIYYGGYEMISRVEKYDEITPIWGVAIGLKDRKKLEDFVSQFLKKQDGIYTLSEMLYVGFRNDVCFITSNIQSLDLLTGELSGKNLGTSEFAKNIEESSVYGYADLNLAAIAKKAGVKFDYDPINTFFESLEFKMVEDNSVEFIVNLSEKNNNSLYTLLKVADREYRKQVDGL